MSLRLEHLGGGARLTAALARCGISRRSSVMIARLCRGVLACSLTLNGFDFVSAFRRSRRASNRGNHCKHYGEPVHGRCLRNGFAVYAGHLTSDHLPYLPSSIQRQANASSANWNVFVSIGDTAPDSSINAPAQVGAPTTAYFRTCPSERICTAAASPPNFAA